MNITYENKLFQGVIDNSITEEVIIPVNKALYTNPGLLSGKLNELRQQVQQISENIYLKADVLDKEILYWNSVYPRLLSQVEQLESDVNDRLFLRSDSDGFFETLYENFTVSDMVDSTNSENVAISFTENCVRLLNSMQIEREVASGLYQVRINKGEGSALDRLVSVTGSAINNLYENNMSGWTAVLISENRTTASISVVIDLAQPTDIGEVSLSLLDINGSMVMSALVMDEANSSYGILNNVDVSNTNIIPINRVAKKIQIILTKNLYDNRNYEDSTYRYLFHLKSLKLFKNITGFFTEGTFVSNLYPIFGHTKFAVEVCDYTGLDSKIEYYLKLVDSTIFSNDLYAENVLSSGSGLIVTVDGTQSDSSLAVTGNYLLEDMNIQTGGSGYEVGDVLKVPGNRFSFAGVSPGNDLTLVVGSVDGSGAVTSFSSASGIYIYGKVAQIQPINKPPSGSIPYGLYLDNDAKANNLSSVLALNLTLPPTSALNITNDMPIYNFTNQYKVVNSILFANVNRLSSFNVFTNHSLISSTNRDTWNRVSDMYETWIYVDGSEDNYLDPGTSGLTVQGLERSTRGFHLNKTGWFKVRVPTSGYYDAGTTFTSLTQLMNIDPLYPSNGKYLVEGSNISEAPYKGFKIRAKQKLMQVNNLGLIKQDNFYLMRVPQVSDYLTSLGSIPLCVLLDKETDARNVYVEYGKVYNYNGYSLRLIAKLMTSNTSETPILSSYKIKLGD
jgi:hypothetical protein